MTHHGSNNTNENQEENGRPEVIVYLCADSNHHANGTDGPGYVSLEEQRKAVLARAREYDMTIVDEVLDTCGPGEHQPDCALVSLFSRLVADQEIDVLMYDTDALNPEVHTWLRKHPAQPEDAPNQDSIDVA